MVGRGHRAPRAPVERPDDAPTGDPLREIAWLIIDGNNLLHRIAGSADPSQQRLLFARLRTSVPAGIETLLVFDGSPDPGLPMRQRIVRGLDVRHAGGHRSADSLIVELVETRPFGDRARTLVITDDRALIERVRRAGGRTERLHAFQRILDAPTPATTTTGPTGAGERTGGQALGAGAPPRRPRGAPRDDASAGPDVERTPWQPGRGATRKRGNAKRGHPPEP